MTNSSPHPLEVLLSAKRQRLSITRSPRSREVLKREMRMLQHQLDELHAKVARPT